MKKLELKHFWVFFLSLIFISAKAEESGYPLGYCNGEVTTKAKIKFSEKQVTVSGAIYIPESYAATVKDNKLSAIKFGLGSTHNVSDVEVWVRKNLENENIVSGKVDNDNLIQGWNEQVLTEPLFLSQDVIKDGFYIGFSFFQENKSAALASIDTPYPNGMWVKCGDNAWEDASEQGTLCIEGLVYGDNLPKLNVSIEDVSVDKWFIIDNGDLNGVISIRNIATETIKSIGIEASFEGVDNVATTVVDCNIPYNETAKLGFTIYPEIFEATPVERNVVITVTSLNGKDDEDYGNNSAQTAFNVIQKAFSRKVFVEEFTTEACSNCPRVAGYLHDILNDPQYSANLTAVCHHSAFGTDKFTIPSDLEYEWFYPNSGTYAPGIMIDRAKTTSKDSPVFCPSSPEQMTKYIDIRRAEPSMVSVEINANIEDKKVKIRISGEYVGDYPFEAQPILTVYLTENNIETISQKGAGGGYLQQHVTRALNDTWGTPMEFSNENTYEYEYEFSLLETFNIENMEIVAMVGDYDPENKMNCEVKNSNSLQLNSAGIDSITDNCGESQKVIYTIDGRKINRIEKPGLYIINGKKIVAGNR